MHDLCYDPVCVNDVSIKCRTEGWPGWVGGHLPISRPFECESVVFKEQQQQPTIVAGRTKILN